MSGDQEQSAHDDSTDIRNLRRIIMHPEFERYTKVNDICLLHLQVIS